MKKLNWNAGFDLFTEFLKYFIGLGFGIMVITLFPKIGMWAVILGYVFCAFMAILKLPPPDHKQQ